MTEFDLTPTERLIILALRIKPHQRLDSLQRNTRTKTLKHLARAVRTLRMAGAVIPETDEDGVERYRLCLTKKDRR
jgi:hypothetical protein